MRTPLNVSITKENHGIDTVVRIGAWVGEDDRKYLVAVKPIELVEIPEYKIRSGEVAMPEPTIRIMDDQFQLMQALTDALWQAGYRPKDIGTPGHLAATQAHLEDMRKIAFTMLSHPQARTVPQ